MAEGSNGSGVPRLRWTVDALGSLAFLAVCVLLLVRLGTDLFHSEPQAARSSRPPLTVPEEPLELDGLPTRGSEEARVAVVEFSDFQCPFCASFARSTFTQLDRDYLATGKVKYVFNHMPLSIHPQAVTAAQSAECARSQGRFWEMHNALFAVSAALDTEGLLSAAKQSGLDSGSFEICMKERRMAPAVKAAMSRASELKIFSTPTFFLGTVQPDGRVKVVHALAGVQEIEAFSALLDSLLRGTGESEP